jgi:hypothetical protein
MSSHAANAVRLAEEERDHLFQPAQPDRNRTPRSAPLPQLLQSTAQHLCGTFGVPPSSSVGAWRPSDGTGSPPLSSGTVPDCRPGEQNVAW